jgi:hypothetical protein
MTMIIDFRAALMLLVTLVLGVALGALGVGALSRQRQQEVRDLHRPDGFVSRMEDAIGPRDSAQRLQIHGVIAATAATNDSIVRAANDQLRHALDSMRIRLTPMLDDGQRRRLDHAANIAPPMRAFPGDGRGDGPPPDRRDAPPGDRRGPPPDGGGPPPDRGPPPVRP